MICNGVNPYPGYLSVSTLFTMTILVTKQTAQEIHERAEDDNFYVNICITSIMTGENPKTKEMEQLKSKLECSH